MTGYKSKKAMAIRAGDDYHATLGIYGYAKQQPTDAPTADEPVGQLAEDSFGRGQVMWFKKPEDKSMLYTRPQSATWVGLTDEEHYALADKAGCMSADWVDYAKSIEQTLKNKNT